MLGSSPYYRSLCYSKVLRAPMLPESIYWIAKVLGRPQCDWAIKSGNISADRWPTRYRHRHRRIVLRRQLGSREIETRSLQAEKLAGASLLSPIHYPSTRQISSYSTSHIVNLPPPQQTDHPVQAQISSTTARLSVRMVVRSLQPLIHIMPRWNMIAISPARRRLYFPITIPTPHHLPLQP